MGDRISFAVLTAILGDSLGIQNLPYIQFTGSDAEAAFIAMGLSRNVAHSYVELMQGIADGLVNTTLIDRLQLSAPTRFKQFAEEVFKPAFQELKQHTTA